MSRPISKPVRQVNSAPFLIECQSIFYGFSTRRNAFHPTRRPNRERPADENDRLATLQFSKT